MLRGKKAPICSKYTKLHYKAGCFSLVLTEKSLKTPLFSEKYLIIYTYKMFLEQRWAKLLLKVMAMKR
jgi:hypothetical protein